MSLRSQLVLSVLMCCVRPAMAQTHSAPAEHNEAAMIRAELVEKDLRMIRNLRELLPPAAKTLEAFRLGWGVRFSATDLHLAERDAGFGCHDAHVEARGGYFACVVDLAAHEGRIVALRVHCRTPDRLVWNDLKRRILNAWDGWVREDDLGVTWEFTDAALAGQRDAAVAAALGLSIEPAASAPATDKKLDAHFRLLMSALEAHRFGDVCHDTGEPPTARVAMNALVSAGRFDLVRNVLRSANPESRVYAAETLLKRRAGDEPLTAAEQSAIARIRDLPTPIQCCGEGVLIRKPARELLESP